MTSLTVITEEFEEEIPEECSEMVQKLKEELKLALTVAEDYKKKFERIEQNDLKIKELMSLCQSKNTEIFALERKVKDLAVKNEEKDKQIISMLSMVKDFKFLVESNDKGVQTEQTMNGEIRQKILQTEEKNEKIKDMIADQNEEIQKLRGSDLYIRESLTANGKKKLDNRPIENRVNENRSIENKSKPGGYYPLFLRKPKDGMV